MLGFAVPEKSAFAERCVAACDPSISSHPADMGQGVAVQPSLGNIPSTAVALAAVGDLSSTQHGQSLQLAARMAAVPAPT